MPSIRGRLISGWACANDEHRRACTSATQAQAQAAGCTGGDISCAPTGTSNSEGPGKIVCCPADVTVSRQAAAGTTTQPPAETTDDSWLTQLWEGLKPTPTTTDEATDSGIDQAKGWGAATGTKGGTSTGTSAGTGTKGGSQPTPEEEGGADAGGGDTTTATPWSTIALVGAFAVGAGMLGYWLVTRNSRPAPSYASQRAPLPSSGGGTMQANRRRRTRKSRRLSKRAR